MVLLKFLYACVCGEHNTLIRHRAQNHSFNVHICNSDCLVLQGCAWEACNTVSMQRNLVYMCQVLSCKALYFLLSVYVLLECFSIVCIAIVYSSRFCLSSSNSSSTFIF